MVQHIHNNSVQIEKNVRFFAAAYHASALLHCNGANAVCDQVEAHYASGSSLCFWMSDG